MRGSGFCSCFLLIVLRAARLTPGRGCGSEPGKSTSARGQPEEAGWSDARPRVGGTPVRGDTVLERPHPLWLAACAFQVQVRFASSLLLGTFSLLTTSLTSQVIQFSLCKK